METTPLKIEVNETVFAIDGDRVTVLRRDQPSLTMPLKDVVAFVQQLGQDNTSQ